MDLKSLCKTYRYQMQISQVDFSHLTGVSLPCLQQIEAGKGNPTLKTVRKILKVMGLDIHLNLSPYNWERLISLGLPLSLNKKEQLSIKKPSASLLCSEVHRASLSLLFDPQQEGAERKKEALQALILAIQTHYPSLYKRIYKKGIPKDFFSYNNPGKVIKLKRIALRRLSFYL